MERASEDELIRFQEQRLAQVLKHAEAYVPHYRSLFARLGARPSDFSNLTAFKSFPVLTRDTIRDARTSLEAGNASRYRPSNLATSGSLGQPISFLLDRATNGLEFAYYWRYWNWNGYRLGDRFAEFSSTFFLKRPELAGALFFHQKGTGRVLLNSLYLSRENAGRMADVIARMGCGFLKGLPSVVLAFTRFLEDDAARCRIKTVFTTGEVLMPAHRREIETAFGATVRDSYGHMERAVAAAECEKGRLHVNSDYGLMELVPVGAPTAGGLVRSRVVATGLHNFSMPLIRYDVGDVVEHDPRQARCPCGRQMPVISRVEGRENDVVRTPDGRVVTTLFLAFDEVPGVRWGQVVQERLEELRVRVLVGPGADPAGVENGLRKTIAKFTGPEVRLSFEFVDEGAAFVPGRKFRSVVSCLPKN